MAGRVLGENRQICRGFEFEGERRRVRYFWLVDFEKFLLIARYSAVAICVLKIQSTSK